MPMTGKPVMKTAFANFSTDGETTSPASPQPWPSKLCGNAGWPGIHSLSTPGGKTNKHDKVRVNANVVLNCQKPNDATMSLTSPHSPPATLFRPFVRAFTIYDQTRLAWARPVMSRSWSHEQMCTWRMVHLTIFGWISSQ